jgi:lipoprotein-anchoring transpeptidase ErfK/SrfK
VDKHYFYPVISISCILALAGCSSKKGKPGGEQPATSASAAEQHKLSALVGQNTAAPVGSVPGKPTTAAKVDVIHPQRAPIPEGDIVGAITGQVNIYAEPRTSAKRYGYLRLGGVISRESQPVGSHDCDHGQWYKVKPRGFVCIDEKDATKDRNHAILKAASLVRPDLAMVMPYRYGFVRAVLPLYLRVPSKKQQLKSEFQLKEHMKRFKELGGEKKLNDVVLGSYDVPLDEHGIPLVGQKVGDVAKPSTEWSQGVLFGGQSDDDPIPDWLADGKRTIPNVADFKVPEYSVFADRARRHTGLSFIGSFLTNIDGLRRRFGITTDLRLAPTTKVKPDTGSPWHGIALNAGKNSPPLPFGWVRTTQVSAYRLSSDGDAVKKGKLPKRAILKLNGKRRKTKDGKFLELSNGYYVREDDISVVANPDTWPKIAESGKKWIEVSITNQSLIMWEGKKPIYATMVSTGRDKMGDPKKTLSTVRGEFQIRNKHITATMDSNEGSSAGGKKSTFLYEPGTGNGIRLASVGPQELWAPPLGNESCSGNACGGTVLAGWEQQPFFAIDNPSKSAFLDSKKEDPFALFGGNLLAKKGDSKSKGKEKGKSKKPKLTKAEIDRLREINRQKGRDEDYGVTKRRGEGAFWLRDVPYVQYFESGFALHVAYWHDVFGIARSHGCINLSPIDGKVLFNWTEPSIPEGWHALDTGQEMGEGTTIIIHE